MMIRLQTETKSVRFREGERAARNSVFVIIVLALIEALVGFLAANLILIMDALHNFVDCFASFASWFGLRLSQKKPSERFAFGYYKAESLAALFVSFFILYASVELIWEGYLALFTTPEITMPFESLFVSLFLSGASFLLAKYVLRVGERINSASLVANAKERFLHVFSSIIIFVAILLTWFAIPYVEGLILISFSFVILKTGVFIARDSVFALMDISPNPKVEVKVKEIIGSTLGVLDFKDLRLRRSGPLIFGEVVVKIRKSLDVKRAHEISDIIEQKIKDEVSSVDSFIVHIEPFKSRVQRIVIPIQNDDGFDSEIMNHFGRSNYFLFMDVKGGEVRSFFTKPNSHKLKELRAGLAVTQDLLDESVDVIITRQIGEISIHVLRDHLIDVYLTKRQVVKDALADFFNNNLELIKRPTRKIGTEQFRKHS